MSLQRIVLLCIVFLSFDSKARVLVFSGIAESENSVISERVLREAYATIGIDIRVEFYPGKRALMMSGAGRVDGELFRIGNLQSQYPDLIQVPTSINLLEGVYVSTDPALQIQDWPELDNYFVGIQRGIKFVEKALAPYPNLRLLTVNKNAQLLQALGSGRIDVAILARLNALSTIQAFPDVRFHVGDDALVTHLLFHYLHRKHEKLVPLLDKALRTMTAQGRIVEIRQRYIDSFKAPALKSVVHSPANFHPVAVR
ncbi:MAG: hypothetical protein C9356_13930 [Oleiphilus sp.]|nr:MAG: hypothetical protein C9356_13930 [Oleiphilus sp.]